MKEVYITIIVPIFNTPQIALERLAESLLKQKDKRFKTIFVDDGSCNEISKIIDNVSLKLKDSEVIHKINGGVSSARNVGIANASTEYLSFVDADDTLSSNYVLELNNAIDNYHSDIVYASIVKNPIGDTPKQSDGKISYFSDKTEVELVKEALLEVNNRKLKFTILGTPCARAYKTEIANKIRFREDISFYEDQLFNREYLEHANTALVIPNIIYTYEQNDYSAMHKNRNDNFYKKTLPYLNAFYEMNQKEELKYRKSLRKEQLEFLYATINYDYIYNHNRSYEKYKKEIQEIIKQPIYQDSIRNLKLTLREDGMIDFINFILIKRRLYLVIYINKLIIYYIRKLKSVMSGVDK